MCGVLLVVRPEMIRGALVSSSRSSGSPVKKQKPARKRGNPAKQRAKSAGGLSRATTGQLDPLTSLARTAGSNAPAKTRHAGVLLNLSLPKALPKSLASSATARLSEGKLNSHSARSKSQAVARALRQGYAWEDREAFAIVCAPFLILALWFTYQHTMRMAPLGAPEIAILRESAARVPVISMAPQTPVAPTMAKPIEITPALPVAPSISPLTDATVAPAPVAMASLDDKIPEPAPFVTEAPVPLPALASIIRPIEPPAALTASGKSVPVPEAATPAAPTATPRSPRIAAKRALPSLALIVAPPAEPLAPLASIIAEPAVPQLSAAAHQMQPDASPATAPLASRDTLADTLPSSGTQQLQQLAALAPMAPPAAPEAAPAIASLPPPAQPTLPPNSCHAPQTLFTPVAARAVARPQPRDFGLALARAARDQLSSVIIYNAKYARIGFPNGDVAPLFGVCTDVIVRAYRTLGVDLQQLIADTKSGRGDRNIDHRRVEVIRRFLTLHGETLPVSEFAEDYRPGDIVTYYRPQNRSSTAHIAIVSDIPAPSGRYMIVHNRGWGPQLEDALFVDKMTGHYRFAGVGRKEPDTAPVGAAQIASATPWVKEARLQLTRADGTEPSQPVNLAARGAAQAALCHPGRGGVALAAVPAVAPAPAPAAAVPAGPAAAVKPPAAKSPSNAMQKAATGARGKAGLGRTVVADGNS